MGGLILVIQGTLASHGGHGEDTAMIPKSTDGSATSIEQGLEQRLKIMIPAGLEVPAMLVGASHAIDMADLELAKKARRFVRGSNRLSEKFTTRVTCSEKQHPGEPHKHEMVVKSPGGTETAMSPVPVADPMTGLMSKMTGISLYPQSPCNDPDCPNCRARSTGNVKDAEAAQASGKASPTTK